MNGSTSMHDLGGDRIYNNTCTRFSLQLYFGRFVKFFKNKDLSTYFLK